VKPLRLLEQTGPVLLAELLLLELELDVFGGVVGLGLCRVDLGVELELDVVLALEGGRGAGEGEGSGLKVDLDIRGGDVRDGDSKVDEVLGGVGGRGALRPQDWRLWVSNESALERWGEVRLAAMHCSLMMGEAQTHPQESRSQPS
jgi:hypothetical protein